jgi:hypothetical protein
MALPSHFFQRYQTLVGSQANCGHPLLQKAHSAPVVAFTANVQSYDRRTAKSDYYACELWANTFDNKGGIEASRENEQTNHSFGLHLWESMPESLKITHPILVR